MKRTVNIFLSFLLVFGMFLGNIQISVFAEDETEEDLGKLRVVTDEELFNATYEFNEESTALDVLLNAVGEDNVETSDTGYGISIDGIFDIVPDEDETLYWEFYINGVSAQEGSGTYRVNEGDNLTFKYTDWNEPADNSVSLTVINDDETLHNTGDWPVSILVEEDPTAFDLLLTVMGHENIDYSIDPQWGPSLDGIAGITVEDPYYWAFYVNDGFADVGFGSYTLQNDDLIKFNYESWATEDEDDGTDDQDNNESDSPSHLDKEIVQASMDAAKDYIMSHDIGDWQAIALKQGGYSIPEDYLDNAKQDVIDNEGFFRAITTAARLSLGIIAAGGDPTNIEGYNVFENIYNHESLENQNLIGPAFGLIAFDNVAYEIPGDAMWQREEMIDHILEKQVEDGGWNWTGQAPSDLDSTAMILTSLLPYDDNADVQEAIERATDFLVDSFINGDVDNSSTAAQLVITFSALGLDANGYQNDDGESLIEYLLTFQNENDGGFGWIDDSSDAFSAEQGFRGVVSYHRFIEGKPSLYTFENPSDSDEENEDGNEENEDENDNDNDNPQKPSIKEIVFSSMDAAKNYVKSHGVGDWQAIALSQAGYEIPDYYLGGVKERVVEEEGQFRNITDTARYILGILAAGEDPTNIEGYDLIEKIYNGTNVTNQGLVGVAFSLIALDSANYQIPDDAEWTRQALIDYLLDRQLEDGGWNWTGSSPSDLDSTAMILTSLAPYADEADVQASINAAENLLGESFTEGNMDNSSTAAQMIIALSALEQDANEYQNNNDESLIEFLLTFQDEDGGFGWQNNSSDPFSTEQAFRGVVAYHLFLEGKSSLYSFDDHREEPKKDPEDEETPISDGTNEDDLNNDDSTTEEDDQVSGVNSDNEDRLPNTATPNFNLLVLGMLLLLFGSAYLIRMKRLERL